MTLTLTNLGGHMAAAVEGVDLAAADGATVAALRQSLLDHLVLCIRGQDLAPRDYLAAMARFGTPLVRRQQSQHPEVEAINILSSEDRDMLGDGKRLVVGAHWHTDDSFMAKPCSLTMLYGVEVPETGGDTQFTNMYAAYDGLTNAMKARIGELRVVHKWDSSRKGTRVATLASSLPDATHPLVRTHPETGRKALYLNPNRMERIVGMDRSASDALLDGLITHAIQPQFQYRHKWRSRDVVIWDNRCTMHKANADYPAGARRFMHRIVVEGTVPV
ncbi:MAG TPA: TauD/TfdA family dioxygenase [Candidatus Sulfotelmatobacter sp.]|nr:TauD/TfdA family dioxygenase [Candidatus Sulfotelmatobacter sp.]